MAYKRKLNASVPRRFGRPRQSEGPEYEKMDRLLEPMEFSRDSSFEDVWPNLVNALNDSGPFPSRQKLYAVANMILQIKTETLRFFPIVEFFEGDPKLMVQILQRISGKTEITEFRFLKDDKQELLEQNWNGCLDFEDLRSDLGKVRVELKKMSHLHTIKIDVYPIFLKDLMDLCENLRSLTTLEVIIKYDIDLNIDRSKDVRTPMKRLRNLKYNLFVEEKFHDISSFEKVLDEFFMCSLPNARVIGKPGRFVDIIRVFEDLYENYHGNSKLTHIAHKLREDVTQSLHTVFGDVDRLHIEWCQDEFGSDFKFDEFLTFPYISHLTLTNVPKPNYVRRFIDVYHEVLKDVTVKFSTAMKFSMNPFQEMFMSLQKLVVGVIKPNLGNGSIWSLKDFQCLIELEIEFAINWNARGTICVVPINRLLSAPNLEKVKLFGDLAVDVEHLQKLRDRIIATKKILTKVNDFEMRIIWQGSATNVTTSQEDIDRKKELMRTISQFFFDK